MSDHELWHVAVLATSLLGAAAAAILFLGPLVLDRQPLPRTRRWVIGGLAATALVLVAVEWLVIHPRSL